MLPLETHRSCQWVTKANGELVRKEDKFVYVPVLKTLEILLQNEAFSNQVYGI